MTNATPCQRGLAADMKSGEAPRQKPHGDRRIQLIAGKHEHPSAETRQPSRPNVVGRQRSGNA